MRFVTLLLSGLVLLMTGCAKAPQEKTITIVNAAAVDASLLERLRVFAEQELHVPVRIWKNRSWPGRKVSKHWKKRRNA